MIILKCYVFISLIWIFFLSLPAPWNRNDVLEGTCFVIGKWQQQPSYEEGKRLHCIEVFIIIHLPTHFFVCSCAAADEEISSMSFTILTTNRQYKEALSQLFPHSAIITQNVNGTDHNTVQTGDSLLSAAATLGFALFICISSWSIMVIRFFSSFPKAPTIFKKTNLSRNL